MSIEQAEREVLDVADDSTLRVLLVEDSPSDRLLMVLTLGEAGIDNDRITQAATLREARRALALDSFDCVMLDLSLPDADGLESVRVVATATPNTPIIVVSGHPADDLVYAAMAEGADEYLHKDDIDPQRLGDLLARARRRRAGSRRTGHLWEDAAAALDGISSPAVALDGAGRIIAMNYAWMFAARDRGADDLTTGLGVNYLTVCDQAAGPFSERADEVATGIRAVLHGELDTFSVDYPCPSGREERWFSVRVTPLGELGGGAVAAHLDITDLKLAERRMRGRDLRPSGLDGSAPVLAMLDEQGTVLHLSPSTIEVLGLQDRSVIGAKLIDRVAPDTAAEVSSALSRVIRQPGASEPAKVRIRNGVGQWRELDVTFTNLIQQPGVHSIVVSGADVTEARRHLIVRKLESRVLQRMPMPMALVDQQGVVVFVNHQAEEMLGLDLGDLCGHTVDTLQLGPVNPGDATAIAESLDSTGRWDGEHEVRLPDGTVVPIRATMEAIYEEDIDFEGIVVAWMDVTERRRLEDDLAFQGLHDPLTALPNRRLFVDHLDTALARARRLDNHIAVVVFDVDNFKAVNDRVGHVAADEILRSIGDLTAAALRTGDVAAHFGGDEFAFCFEDLHDASAAVPLAEGIIALLSAPFRCDGEEFEVTASAGLAVSNHAIDAEGLIHNASQAMYAAKMSGKARLSIFDEQLDQRVQRRQQIARALDAALEDGSICTHFQPQYDLFTGDLVGFEALARWEDPTLGVVGPDEFIPIAEDHGRIHRLGRQVLRDSAVALRQWLDSTPEHPISVAVNVSARQLTEPTFPTEVADAIAACNVPAGRICLEITESALIDPAVAAHALRRLKEVGVKIAIDDFGTGYSSLSRLHRFPLDYLKVDRMFVAGMRERPEDEMIVTLVIQLAHAMGLTVVAEGIEDEEQVQQLVALGCEYGQGYLFGRAMTPDRALEEVGRQVHTVAATSSPVGDQQASIIDEPIDTDSALAILAHELAGPITVIAGCASLLQDGTMAAEDTQAFLEAIGRAAGNAQAAVDLVRDASVGHTGKLHLNRCATTVAAIVDDALDLFVPVDSTPISVDIADCVLDADHHRLVAIVVNLLTNAQRHAPGAHVRITTSASADDGSISIHVIDDGPGVPAPKVGTIFRRFGRADPTKPGTGLGLYVARSIARAHGGDLRYETPPGGGADFVVEIPRHTA